MSRPAPVRLYLVRHGRAEAGWDTSLDPGLDDLGRRQAETAARQLAALIAEPIAVISSPLRRCRETAAPLAETWGATVTVEPAVAEIPSPEGVPMDRRTTWLRAAMTGTWADLGPRYAAFRDGLVDTLRRRRAPAVVVSHFVAINAVIGTATGDDRLVIRSLDNASITVVDVLDEQFSLVEAGHEADTLIR